MRGVRVRSNIRRRSLLAALVATLVVGLFAAPAGAQEDPPVELPPGGTFLDDDGSTHEGNIEAIYAAGITLGCTEDGQYFCPQDPVLRKYMAAFLRRALELPNSKKDYFTDDDGLFEGDINAVAKAGITLGCTTTEFCPDVPMRARSDGGLHRAGDGVEGRAEAGLQRHQDQLLPQRDQHPRPTRA